MFAYCVNNPIMFVDNGGEFGLIAAGIIVVAGVLVGGFLGGVSSSKSGGSFWKGFLEGGIIGGGSATIGLFAPEIGAGFALLCGEFFGMGVDCVFQAVEGNGFDYFRLFKAGMGGALGTVSAPTTLAPQATEVVIDAVVSVFITKQLSILYGLFDIATTPYPQSQSTSSHSSSSHSSHTSSTYNSQNTTRPIYGYYGGGGRGFWVQMCQ